MRLCLHLAWMALSRLSEAICLSSSCFSAFSYRRATSLLSLGHSKPRCGPLQRKHEYLGALSFLPFHLSLEGLSFWGDLSRCLLPLLLPSAFSPCPFKDSLLNSMSDSVVAIAEARSYTLCLSSSILAHPHRSLRKKNKASCTPMVGVSKKSSWNSLMYSRIWPFLCWRHVSLALASLSAFLGWNCSLSSPLDPSQVVISADPQLTSSHLSRYQTRVISFREMEAVFTF